jgi:tetratricopeptide (TPR) repeat protein
MNNPNNRGNIAVAVLLVLAAVMAFYFVLNIKKREAGQEPSSARTVIENAVSKFNLAPVETPVPFKKPGLSAELPTAKWVPQTMNNCGPAATSMVLQYFGHTVPQTETKASLRTNPDDKNVFINEISEYLRDDYGIQSKVLFNGDIETLKTLNANGIYVVVEAWLRPNEDIGHVLIIRGYDDAEGIVIADDSYFGVGMRYKYDAWEETQWKPYGLEYMPVYNSKDEALVRSIIGEDWDEKTMHQNSVKRNKKEIEDNPNDVYKWFNLGASHYALGEYADARQALEKSQSLGWPKRMLWYRIEPVQTYNKLGEYQKALETADIGLWANDNFAEMHYEKAYAYKKLNNVEKSESELQKTLEFDPGFTDYYNLF